MTSAVPERSMAPLPPSASPSAAASSRSATPTPSATPIGDLSKRPAEDAAQEPAGFGTERRADGDLAASLGDREGHERIDPCRRQENHAEQCHADRQRRGRQGRPLQAVGLCQRDHFDLERRVERSGDLRKLSCESLGAGFQRSEPPGAHGSPPRSSADDRRGERRGLDRTGSNRCPRPRPQSHTSAPPQVHSESRGLSGT